MTEKKKLEKLFWLDLEMTGLEIDKEVIIEVAAIVTDLDFNELGRYESVVQQDQAYLDRMDPWNTKHHGESGLTAKVPFGKKPELVEDELLELIQNTYKPDEDVVIAGNSISQDRLFITKYFRKLDQRLHYRMLDVTAWKLIIENKFGRKYEKTNSHRALEDIRESIGELKFYMSFFKAD